MTHVGHNITTTDGLNKIRSQSRHLYIRFQAECGCHSQGINSKGMFEVGSLRQIPQQITTSHAETTLKGLPHGSLEVTGLMNGQKQGLSSGFMVNVRVSSTSFLSHTLILSGTLIHSGVWQEYFVVSRS